MTHTYKVTGMTCSGCVAKVNKLFKEALADHPKYQLVEEEPSLAAEADPTVVVASSTAAVGADAGEGSWWVTYRPLLILFGYILLMAVLGSGFQASVGMRLFMSGFFLSFSFFKLLDLKGFAESYAMYDIVARRWAGWGYVYAFIELGLGIAFAMNWSPIYVNTLTLVVMGVSIIGVLQSVLNKRAIRCACLGAVFNLPMSTVTIIEDALMIGMAGLGLMTAVG